ncbi:MULTISPECIES: PrsW family intramembrane metalloprotease [unclassified Isoptericola]|uniref:PrsW family intramembrane metalloprotease n=1 Tax=unclassified Isoptericola TaxID=2623355 RepID=UPI0036648F14
MAALDPKAILAGRRPGRPPVGAIVVIAVSSLCLLVVLAVTAAEGPTFAQGLLLALLPLPLLLAGVLSLDRLEPEPPDALVLSFLWGAGVAVLLAMVLNTAGLTLLWAPLLGPEEGFVVTAVLGAPFVEETLKGLVLVGMLWFRRHEIDGPTDGIIYGSMVGLGFATVENIHYYTVAGPDALAATFVARGIATPLVHPLCSSLTGIGVATAALAAPGLRRAVPVLLGLLGAVTYHALWNGAATLPAGATVAVYAVGLVVLVGLLVVVRADRARTVASIGRYLPPYRAAGVVTGADVAMLASLPARRRARDRVRAAGGPGPARALRDYQQAATELAMLHRRAERGLVDRPAFELRREPLLVLMLAARQAFGPLLPEAPPR